MSRGSGSRSRLLISLQLPVQLTSFCSLHSAFCTLHSACSRQLNLRWICLLYTTYSKKSISIGIASPSYSLLRHSPLDLPSRNSTTNRAPYKTFGLTVVLLIARSHYRISRDLSTVILCPPRPLCFAYPVHCMRSVSPFAGWCRA